MTVQNYSLPTGLTDQTYIFRVVSKANRRVFTRVLMVCGKVFAKRRKANHTRHIQIRAGMNKSPFCT